MIGKTFLILSACANFAISLLHFVIPFMGIKGYAYFGTRELVMLESQGSLVPKLATWFLALVFAGFGFYCLSGAGTIIRLPLLSPALWLMGGIYSLRGLLLIPELIGLMRGEAHPFRQLVFSAAALVIGLMIIFGMLWKK